AGYVQLIDHLAAGVNVILDAPVEGIEWSDGSASAGQPAAVVRLRDGRALEADFCVCTLPLGVLKRDHERLFQPPLPDRKKQAICNLGVGVLEKVALRFEHCFWEGKAKQLHCFYRVPTVEARATPAACEAPYWLSLRPVTGSNVLIAYYATETGRIVAKLSEEEAVKSALALLKSMFKPEEVDAAKLLEVKRTAWIEDEWACGAYSFVAVGSSPEDRSALAAPLGALHFAGEATDQ
ncbi:KDM1B, partial [Symbiodinium pilosum]